MKKMIVTLATQRPANLLLAGFELAILALGLAGLGLMVPCPVETECTTLCLLDYGGLLFERLFAEDLTERQTILIICFTIGIRG